MLEIHNQNPILNEEATVSFLVIDFKFVQSLSSSVERRARKLIFFLFIYFSLKCKAVVVCINVVVEKGRVHKRERKNKSARIRYKSSISFEEMTVGIVPAHIFVSPLYRARI